MSVNAWLTTIAVIILSLTTTLLGVGNINDARDISRLETRIAALETTRPNTQTSKRGHE